MKTVFLILGIVFLFLIVLFLGSFTYLSIDSKKPRPVGLVNGKLRPCPDTPNCVSSEEPDKFCTIEPFGFKGQSRDAWLKMKNSVIQLGGKIEKSTDNYLWATFQTKFWRFTDDLELQLDPSKNVIQVRSASRVGKGDMGMNRKRVEQLRLLFNKNISQ